MVSSERVALESLSHGVEAPHLQRLASSALAAPITSASMVTANAFLDHYITARKSAPITPWGALQTAPARARQAGMVLQNPALETSNNDGTCAASIVTHSVSQKVDMQWSQSTSQVPFSAVDSNGLWLQRHAPAGDAEGFCSALRHTHEQLSARVQQIVSNGDVLAKLSRQRAAVMGSLTGAGAWDKLWPAAAPEDALAGLTVIYGGSFNPPHVGHAMACRHLMTSLNAKSIWVMPSFVRADKPHLSPFHLRVEMCCIMQAGLGPRVMVADSEETLGGVANSYELTDHLLACYPNEKFVFALGADLEGEAPTWPGWQRIVNTMRVAVIPRGGYARAPTVALPTVSSTEIRSRVAAGESIDHLVPAGIEDYIKHHRLYVPSVVEACHAS